MITYKDKEFRNLVEQVQANKEEIAKHWDVDRILADFGIKIQGQRNSYDDIKDIDEGENYGYAYLIGTAEPYDVWIWSRPDINAGKPNAYWLDIGHIAIQGPQGIQGIQGPKGDTGESTKWHLSLYKPSENDSIYKDGDFCLVNSGTEKGNVYKYSAYSVPGNKWMYMLNIMGPQGSQGIMGPAGIQGPVGPQGPKGDTGDVGGLVNIAGILDNATQLPTPASLGNTTIAYLVGAAEPYDLYIQIGIDPATAIWNNVGPLNVATLVTVGGNYQNVWDADTKLDKDTSTTTYNQVYVKAANSGQGTINVTKQVVADAVVQRQSDGNIALPSNPGADEDAVNKNYVDSSVSDASAWQKLSTTTDKLYILGNDTATINSSGLSMYINTKQRLLSLNGRVTVTATSDWSQAPGFYFKPGQIIELIGSLSGIDITSPITVTEDGVFATEMGYVAVSSGSVKCLQFESKANHRAAGARIFYINCLIPL